MTKEEKDLLFKDLAQRLPYRVKVHIPFLNHVETLIGLDIIDGEIRINGYISDVKPYLRPMSSMNEEERLVYLNLTLDYTNNKSYKKPTIEVIDWLNKYHFDYRGLIKKGLAIEVTESNNPYKD